MIYLFSSSFYDLFRQNVLNACCYPDGYVMRLRYGREYLSPELTKNDAWRKLSNKSAVLVFAEGALANKEAGPSDAKRDYHVFPIRYCSIESVQMTAGIFIIDIKLGKFLQYGDKIDKTKEEAWDTEIKAHANRPFPKGLREAEGSYVYSSSALTSTSGISKDEAEMAWRSVVDRLNQSELRECVTYQIRGFYRVNGWPRRIFGPDHLISPTIKGPDAVGDRRDSPREGPPVRSSECVSFESVDKS